MGGAPIKFGCGVYATAGVYRDCCSTRQVKTIREGEGIVKLVAERPSCHIDEAVTGILNGDILIVQVHTVIAFCVVVKG